uniref:Amidohydrolase family protein n=1 Tax=Myoviridae sp. ct89I2 TaxID=2827662 RepID=A0A8S5TCK8_9CAUD|nr:MAG TPA: amidohydrolase family protein [Myoviridae sp. ct89I2]
MVIDTHTHTFTRKNGLYSFIYIKSLYKKIYCETR